VGSLRLSGLPVDFVLGEPIDTAGMTLKDREELTALMRARVVELLESLDSEPAAAQMR
jgi:hypothetical protein